LCGGQSALHPISAFQWGNPRADFTGLTSSWAPFLVGAAGLLRPGGRLAFVVSSEIGHAPYAAPLLDYLVERFAHVQGRCHPREALSRTVRGLLAPIRGWIRRSHGPHPLHRARLLYVLCEAATVFLARGCY
jgi:hypothetical protein